MIALKAPQINRQKRLSLPLLVAGLNFADHSQGALALDDLAVAANFLYRCTNFH